MGILNTNHTAATRIEKITNLRAKRTLGSISYSASVAVRPEILSLTDTIDISGNDHFYNVKFESEFLSRIDQDSGKTV